MASSRDILRKVQDEITGLAEVHQVEVSVSGMGNDFFYLDISVPQFGLLLSIGAEIAFNRWSGEEVPAHLYITTMDAGSDLEGDFLSVPVSSRGIGRDALKKAVAFADDAIRSCLLSRLEKIAGLSAEIEFS